MKLQELLTENDNITLCWARCSSALVLVAFFGGVGYDLYVSHIFHIEQYATGAMQILAGSAAIIGAKNITGSK